MSSVLDGIANDCQQKIVLLNKDFIYTLGKYQRFRESVPIFSIADNRNRIRPFTLLGSVSGFMQQKKTKMEQIAETDLRNAKEENKVLSEYLETCRRFLRKRKWAAPPEKINPAVYDLQSELNNLKTEFEKTFLLYKNKISVADCSLDSGLFRYGNLGFEAIAVGEFLELIEEDISEIKNQKTTEVNNAISENEILKEDTFLYELATKIHNCTINLDLFSDPVTDEVYTKKFIFKVKHVSNNPLPDKTYNAKLFLTVKVPDFIIKDKKDNSGYYYFKGVELYVPLLRNFSDARVFILERNYNHPAVSRDSTPSDICIQSYNPSQIISANPELHEQCKRLAERGIDVILTGYDLGCRPRSYLKNYDNTDQVRKLTNEELQQFRSEERVMIYG